MPRFFSLLFGPEILWLGLYWAAAFLKKANQPTSHPMDKFIDGLYLWVPLLVLLTFGLWYVPAVEKRWLLLRVWVVCLVAGHFVLEKGMSAYSQQGPGIGMGYLVGIILVLAALCAGSLFVKIRFDVSLVFFKWVLVVLAALWVLGKVLAWAK